MAITNIVSFVNNVPWAMTPAGIASLVMTLDSKLNNTEAYQTMVALEQRSDFGDKMSSNWEYSNFKSNSGRNYDYLKVSGTLVPRTGSMQPMCGMTPTISLAEMISTCQAECLILHADSGGGSIMGIPELASAINKLVLGGTEVIAYTDTKMASAMYWACSPASQIIASPSAIVGSLGVYSVLTKTKTCGDSESMVIKAGDKKAYGSPDLAITEEEVASIQERVTATYNKMCGEVAQYRGCSVDEIIGTQADYYNGDVAPSFLVDGVMTLSELLTKAKES